MSDTRSNLSCSFNDELEANHGITKDYSVNSDILIIAFGGMAGNLIIPPFEFFKITSDIPTKKLYLRDFEQVWYHSGVVGYADSVETLKEFLLSEIVRSGSTKVIIIGNSLGGYAALLFGFLLQANRVLSFSPQTFLGRSRRLLYGDTRFKPHINNLYLRGNQKFFNLKPFLKERSVRTEFNIFYSEFDRQDSVHAKRLRKCERVNIHGFRIGGHGLVKHLRDDGRLKEILLNSLSF
ncbi:MAG: hypothetical protein AAFN40_14220 [Cyanobacteria bacterium J06560_6]